jgi:Gas vesicle synthesis protein GvpL/GvpF
MSWYAYCIVEQQTLLNYRARRIFPLPGMTGIGGAQVFAFPSGEFSVIVSELPPSGLESRAALEHAQVIAECFRRGTVLPLRYGTVFESEEGVRQSLRVNRKTFMASVAQLRGKAEMRLKVMLQDVAAVHSDMPAGCGVAYLTSLHAKASAERERQSRARTVSQQVHRVFNPLQEEVSCKKTPKGELLLDIAHLIDSESVSKYQNRLNAAQRQLPHCQVVLTGPWPPYHFMPDRVRTVAEN